MTRPLLIALSLFTFILLPTLSRADEPPISSYTAQFEAKVAGFKMGEIERGLKQIDNGLYDQTSLVYSTGLLSMFRPDRFEEHSYWRWVDNAPVPERYTYHFSGNKGEFYEELRFDWEKMQVHSLRDGKTTILPIEKGVVDKLSYQIALVRDLRNGKKAFHYLVADRGDIRNIRYKVVGEEDIETPWGIQHTIKVQRQTLTNERVTILWFAPELDYMVIKLMQDDSGTKMSATITELKIDGMNLVRTGSKSGKDESVIWPSD